MAIDFNKAVKNRVILLSGAYAAERRAALQGLLASVDLQDAGAMDRENMVSTDRSFADWISAVSTIPFFADRRCVVVRNLARLHPESAAESLSLKSLATLPESALLILVADEEGSSDQPSSKHATNLKAWEKVVKEQGGIIISFETPKDKGGVKIREKARDLGKDMSPRTAGMLIEMVAGRYDRAEEELQKLVLYVGDANTITEHDLKQSVTAEDEYNIWRMLDAITAGDSRTALRQYGAIRSQTRDMHAESMRLLPVISGYIRQIWQARGFIDAASNDEAIKWQPRDRPFTKQSDWQQERSRRIAARLSYPTLLACLRSLGWATSRITGQRQSYTTDETMEQLVLTMSHLCRRS